MNAWQASQSYQRKLKDGVPTDSIENKDTYHCLDALRYVVALLREPQVQARAVVYNQVSLGRDW